MHIDIQSRGFHLTQGLRAYTERRLRIAFGATQAWLGRISIRLADVNGPRGGEDKRCRVHVNIRGASAVSIEDTESDLYIAIERAIDRAGRTVARRLVRLREVRHIVAAGSEGLAGSSGRHAGAAAGFA